MVDFHLKKARGDSGAGNRTVHSATSNEDDGNTYDTGLAGGIDQVFVTGTSSSIVANVTNLDGSGTITLSIEDNGGSGQNGEDVHIFAVGSRA